VGPRDSPDAVAKRKYPFIACAGNLTPVVLPVATVAPKLQNMPILN